MNAFSPTTVADALAELDEHEVWRPALIAFWRSEVCFQRAANLHWGLPFDDADYRTIASIKAAIADAPVMA